MTTSATPMNRIDRQVLPMALQGNGAAEESIVLERGDGIRLWDVAGNEYIDSMSGLMNVNTGYGRAELVEAARAALEPAGFFPLFYGFTNPPALGLADRLVGATPASIESVLFTAGGSDAVDSAIKIARRYHALGGSPGKTKIIGRKGSYHGMTLGALNAMGDEAYRLDFGPLSPEFAHIEQPEAGDPAAAEALERAIEDLGADNVAAFIAEPVSLPPGVRIPPDGYWARIREICTRHDVVLILDEVITGFGRTGKLFAAEHWQLEPDMLTMAKGLSGGYLPLGAVGLSAAIRERAVEGKRFLHGFTAGGHPASCAVASRNLEIIEREGLVEQSARVGGHLKARLEDVSARRGLSDVRGLGMMAGLDILPKGRNPAAADWLGVNLPRHLRRRGLLIRQYAETTMLAPSLVATEGDVDEIVDRYEALLDEALAMAPPLVTDEL